MKKIFSLVWLSIFLFGCGTVQDTVTERNRAIGPVANKSNYFEAQQIKEIEEWKDKPGKIVMLYANFPVYSDNVIIIQCKGVPTSSTESLEPNNGLTYAGNTFIIPDIDGGSQSIRTDELAGRDGTYGEPIQLSQCMGIDGHYYDIRGVPAIVSSNLMQFPKGLGQADVEGQIRLMQAQRIIESGGCVSMETLEQQECPK